MEQRSRSKKKPHMESAQYVEDRYRGKGGEKHRTSNVKRSKRRKKRRRLLINLILGFVILLMAGYITVSLHYKNRFLPNTNIDGVNVSGKTEEAVWEEVKEGIAQYRLLVNERDGHREEIEGKDIGLQLVYDERLKQILENQNPLLWGMSLLKGRNYEQNCIVTYDKEKLEALVSDLECLDPEQITEPTDASLVWKEDRGLVIVPEEEGNAPVYERLLKEVERAVGGLKTEIFLDELGIYRKPQMIGEDSALLRRKEQWEQYTSVKVTYRFDSQSEIVDGSLIMGWLTEDEAGDVLVDRTKVEEYVKGLAKKYNTAYCAKELKTSYGPTVKITQGHYGWLIDQAAEVEALIGLIETGQSGEREPVYLQTANSHDGPDYGDTYVEMNLTAQHLFYYKDGKRLIESDFVSGNEAKGWSTPAGIYELTYKQKDATLKGSNYKTPVTYWMPFNGNIGMHDGYWRSSFGGTIYKKNGSHGCINLPPAVAKTVFENIKKGTPVLCYHLNGTETNKTTIITSGKSGSAAGKEKEPTEAITTPAETVSEETKPIESSADNILEETIEAEPSQPEQGKMENGPASGAETVEQQGPGTQLEVPVGPGIPETDAQNTIQPITQTIEAVLSE